MGGWEERLNDTLAQAETLASTAGTAPNTYLLVDFRGRTELARPVKACADLSYGSVWVGTDLAVYDEIAPLLIQVDDLSRFELSRGKQAPRTSELLRLLGKLHEADGGEFAVTHIVSAWPLADLMAHYAYYGEYGLPDGREYYLHFYDSRILDRAFQVWTDEEREHFLGPVHQLRYVRRNGSVAQWVGAGGDMRQRARDSRQQAFTLAQHQALLDMDYPDKLAVQIRRLYLGVLGGGLRQDALYTQVVAQMERARSYGIATERDMLDYVAWGITISPRFDEHEAIAPMLRRFKESGPGLSQALADVPDEVWDALLRAEQTHGRGAV